MQDAEAATHTLEELKALGVILALDDFDTGYSSLRYLQQFPLDAIKIAKPFVDTVAGGPERSVLARAIVDLGKTFGLEVVAEGIERPEQLAALRELGCGFGQGYLLGRPSEAPAVGRLLRPRAPARAGATVRLVEAG
ncbi:MAG: EAL domain-containing protein [Actinobacteria bacterium]|nr:EAL domain-containing protein [Actinomycetota bacterium]